MIGEAAREKIETDLTWDAVTKKNLDLFEEARRSNEWHVTGGGSREESSAELFMAE